MASSFSLPSPPLSWLAWHAADDARGRGQSLERDPAVAERVHKPYLLPGHTRFSCAPLYAPATVAACVRTNTRLARVFNSPSKTAHSGNAWESLKTPLFNAHAPENDATLVYSHVEGLDTRPHHRATIARLQHTLVTDNKHSDFANFIQSNKERVAYETCLTKAPQN